MPQADAGDLIQIVADPDAARPAPPVTADDVLDMHGCWRFQGGRRRAPGTAGRRPAGVSAMAAGRGRCQSPGIRRRAPRVAGRADRRRASRGVGPGRDGPRFAHASEAELARILDFYLVRWEYEPRTFPVLWNLDGQVVESFSPDFYLPDVDLWVELTTLRQSLVRKKNRKLRRMRELYPMVRLKLLYARDFRALMLKYGRLDAGGVVHRHRWPGGTRAADPARYGASIARRGTIGRGSVAPRRPPRSLIPEASPKSCAPPTWSMTSRRSSCPRTSSGPKVAELGAQLSLGLRRPAADAGQRAQGLAAVHGGPDARHHRPPDHRPHGGLLVRRGGHRDLRPGAHPQGPVGDHRGQGRGHRRGHHRHRPDPQLPDALPARQEPAAACGSARCWTSRHVVSWTSTSTTAASPSPTASSSATASTTASSIATCRSSACSGRRSTASHEARAGSGRLLVGIGSVLVIVGAFLPWTYAGGEIGLPVVTPNAFDGAGILTFIAARRAAGAAHPALRASSGRSSLDRWVSFVILGGLMVVGTLLQLVQLFAASTLKLAARHGCPGHVAGHHRHAPGRLGCRGDRGSRRPAARSATGPAT